MSVSQMVSNRLVLDIVERPTSVSVVEYSYSHSESSSASSVKMLSANGGV